MPRRLFQLVTCVGAALFASPVLAQSEQPEPLRHLQSVFTELVSEGHIIGAQYAVGNAEQVLAEGAFGRVSVEGKRSVDAETLFCIGSCSKSLAAACILTLVDDGRLDLDAPIDRYLPDFAKLQLKDGGDATRAPTLRELLAHRGGIYSQKLGMTRRQGAYIRDFSLSLEQSVTGISREPLLWQPGEDFAYSGAGYCVLGRVAEAAARRSIDALLRQRICAPLEMKRTTYFPAPGDPNVAAGGDGSQPPRDNPQTPHLLEERLKLPLVGGSIYSTAREAGRFAVMHLNEGRFAKGRLLAESTWQQATGLHFPDREYGLGWQVLPRDGARRPGVLTHHGALASSRGMIRIDLDRGLYFAGFWTLATPRPTPEQRDAAKRVQQVVVEMLQNLGQN